LSGLNLEPEAQAARILLPKSCHFQVQALDMVVLRQRYLCSSEVK
jgi:hypothetical protein